MKSCDHGTSWCCSHSDSERGSKGQVKTFYWNRKPTQPHAMASSEPNSTVRESYIPLIFILAEKNLCFAHNNPQRSLRPKHILRPHITLRALKSKDNWSFQVHWQGRKTSVSAHELRNNCSFNLVYVAWAQAHFLFPQPSLTLDPFAYTATIQLHKLALQSAHIQLPIQAENPCLRSGRQRPPMCAHLPGAGIFPAPSLVPGLSTMTQLLAQGAGLVACRDTWHPWHPWHQPALDPGLTLLWAGLAPCHPPSGTSSPRKALGAKASSSCRSTGPHIFTPSQDSSQAQKNVRF